MSKLIVYQNLGFATLFIEIIGFSFFIGNYYIFFNQRFLIKQNILFIVKNIDILFNIYSRVMQ